MAIQKNHALVAVVVGVVFLAVGTLVQFSRAAEDQTVQGETTSVQPTVATVSITDTAVVPATLSVKPGTLVEWTNNSSLSHTHVITFNGDNVTDKIPEIAPGQSVTTTFNQAGDFTYTVDNIAGDAAISVKQ